MSTIVLNAGRPTCYLFNGPLEAVSFLPFLSVARSLPPAAISPSTTRGRKLWQMPEAAFCPCALRGDFSVDLLLGVGILRFKSASNCL